MMPKVVAYILIVCFLFVSGISKKPNFLRHRRQAENSNCTLPYHPEHGRWKLISGEANPGDQVPEASVIIFECNSGYKLSSKIPAYCLEQWSSPVPQCEVLCPAFYPSNTYDLKCIDKNGKDINCNEATHETSLEYLCKTYYETPFGYKKTLFCDNGKWDPPKPECHPACGKKTTNDTTPLIYGSKPNEKILHPWVAAIYKIVDDSFEHICGGSILSQTVILTAAHCVTNDYGNVLPKEDYMVGVGKLYRKYQAPSDTRAQYLKLSKIIVPEHYRADIQKFTADIAVLVVKGEISLNEVVQPVCFTNVKDIRLRTGNKGEVSGWGLTEGNVPSEVLQTLVIPYKQEHVCTDELPSDWADRYKVRDKICAGFFNESTSVCSGDSGGGLAFKYREDNRYYIHGIVSVSHQIGNMCNIQQNALYTSVAAHYDFVERLLTRYAPKIKDCVLPPHPKNGKWTTDQGNWKPGDAVLSDTILKVECNKGFEPSPSKSIECRAAQNLPTCEKLCPKLKFPAGTYYRCINREGRLIACSKAIDGSSLWYACPTKYKESSSFNRTCIKGSWGSPKPECVRDCGQVFDESSTGSKYPWNVGIYKFSNSTDNYEYICGGSLVSERVVVTATQCITDKDGYLVPIEDYSIAAGKLYRMYDDARDVHAQFSNISYVNVNPGYQRTNRNKYNVALLMASSPFILDNFIQPICLIHIAVYLEFLKNPKLMIGWRPTEGNSLETVRAVEIVSLKKKFCEVPYDLYPDLFFKESECTSFQNTSACLLPEDRGKGIVFKSTEENTYYLFAVAVYYQDSKCQKNFWRIKIDPYLNTIHCASSLM